jgi:membrane protease YdiL (CAAX protease family)
VRREAARQALPALRVAACVGVALALRVAVAAWVGGGVGEAGTSMAAAGAFAVAMLGIVAARSRVFVPDLVGPVANGRGGARPVVAVDGGHRMREVFSRGGSRGRGQVSGGDVFLGAAGGVVLVLLAVATPRTPLHVWPRPHGVTVLSWTALVAFVAVAEELVFRGVLFDAVAKLGGVVVACAFCAVAFAVVHVPLYGWQALPLDIGVGVWLGGLRMLSGGVAAPAVAHTVADIGAWFLV